MGAIKLINLDQEIFVPIYDEAQGVTYEQIMTIGEMFDKFMGGYQPPIVDAIPVEWLKQQFYDNPKLQWAEKCRDVYTKWQKWQLWQQEQEAR